jgi:ABC-type sugar transport system ATPase subunit
MQVVSDEKGLQLSYEGDGTKIKLTDLLKEKVMSHHEEGKKMVMGIRPEDLSIAAPDTKNCLHGSIYVIENIGKHKIIDVQLAGDIITRVRVAPKEKFSIGENVAVSFDFEMIRLFDRESSNSIMY